MFTVPLSRTPLQFFGLWCKGENGGHKILAPVKAVDHSIMMPFAGFKERYELCSPAVWFRAFALATQSDYFDFITSRCDLKNHYRLIVIDPYDEYKADYNNKSALPPIKARYALRFSTAQFAPGEFFVSILNNTIQFNYEWDLKDFDVFYPNVGVTKEELGKNFNSDMCLLNKCKTNK